MGDIRNILILTSSGASAGSIFFVETRLGWASELVPAFVEELLRDAA